MRAINILEEFNDNKFWGRKGKTEDVIKKVREIIVGLEKGSVVLFDLSGIEIVDWSFSHEIVINFVAVKNNWQLDSKFFVFYNPEEFVLQNIEAALSYESIPGLVSYPDKKAQIIWRDAPEHLLVTYRILDELKEGSVSRIALRHTPQISQTNCNNRLAKLHSYKLIHREKVLQSSGGIEYLYKTVI